MTYKKKHYKKIKEECKAIFNTDVSKTSSDSFRPNLGGAITVVKDPLVKQQIIQLAQLCEDIPENVALKAVHNKITIEFW
jgi:flagellar biosynthesis regulator FlbT